MKLFTKQFLLLFILISFISCQKDEHLELIKRSVRDDVDLYLIPHKFNILETKWLMTKYFANFDKKELIEHLKSYGRTLENLKPKYTEKDGIINMEVAKTSHSTGYKYDTNIPIIFYGKKWFLASNNKEEIHQQHIVPTLSKILKVRNPNGVETESLQKALTPDFDKEIPEIIVTIVLDQGGQQLYNAHPDVPVNIKKIIQKSAYYPNARVGHLDTHTAVGHAAIGTGAYPRKSKVVGNSFFSIKDGKFSKNEIYATEEKKVEPSELLTETLADVLDHEHKDSSEVISQCYALRASIGMAGHGSFPVPNANYTGDKDHIYWLSATDTAWVTDNRYYSLPKNSYQYDPFSYFQKYHPEGWAGLKLTAKDQAAKNWAVLMASPSEVKMESEMFVNALQTEIIDKKKHNDHFPDLAYVTLKAPDAVGHQFGWESLEAKETFRVIDNEVGKIFDFLEKTYGDKFVLVITADHGCAPLPEISGGERLTIEEFFVMINVLLPESARTNESIIKFMTVGQISLDREIMKKYSITEENIIQKIKSIRVENKNFFKNVYTKKDLL